MDLFRTSQTILGDGDECFINCSKFTCIHMDIPIMYIRQRKKHIPIMYIILDRQTNKALR